MTSTTTNYAIPYPDGTDLVKNGASQMQAIAGRVDTVLAAGQFMGGFRNRLINGGFDVWQRGVGAFSTNTAYTADRWQLFSNGGTLSVAQAAVSVTDVNNAGNGLAPMPLLASLLTASHTTTAAFALLVQKIENVATLAGKTVTVSFYARAQLGTPKIGVSFDQYFGVSGSATVQTPGTAVTLSTTMRRYTVTVAMPSVVGKTINPGNYLQLNLWLSAGSDNNTRSGSIGNQNVQLYVTGVQLEAGDKATDFEYRFPGTELALCRRYYRVYGDGGNTPVLGPCGAMLNSGGGYAYMRLEEPMLKTPTGTLTGGGLSIGAGVIGTISTATWNGSSNQGGYIGITGTSIPTAGGYNLFGTLRLEAEL